MGGRLVRLVALGSAVTNWYVGRQSQGVHRIVALAWPELLAVSTVESSGAWYGGFSSAGPGGTSAGYLCDGWFGQRG